MATSMPIVQISDVSKRFVIHKEKSLKERIVNARRSNLHKDDFWALRDVNVQINSGETVGLIGHNGSGKSTLLKLIGGIVQPTHGSITRRGRLAALIELGAGFHPDLTGRENVYLNSALLGYTRKQTEEHFDEIVAFSGIEQFIDTQVKFYSSGMYMRLAFSVAVHVDPDLLLVDEILAVGDEPFQRKCLARIHGFQAEGRTIVIVTHDLATVADLCDRAVVLDHGVLQVDGTPRDALRLLRADYDEAIARDREQARGGETVPSAATVEAVRLLDDSGNAIVEHTPGSPANVEITVAAKSPLRDWVLGFGIETSLGVTIFGTNTKLQGRKLSELVGERTFRFRLPSLALGEGSYTMHGAIALDSGVEVDRKAEATSFAVTSDGQSVGVLYVPTELVSS